MKFEYMKESWFKRRIPTEVIPEVIEYDVSNFKKVVGSKCKMTVVFDTGVIEEFDGMVHVQKTYIIGGEEIIHFWYVNGVTSSGRGISLKLI